MRLRRAGAMMAAGIAALAQPADAEIRPGARMFTEGAQCTSNFFFRDRAGSLYLGYAAHCAQPPADGAVEGQTGCTAKTRPLGTKVEIDGAKRPARLAYSSYMAMQAAGERDPFACSYNDFALARLDAADLPQVNPTVPFWGGPTGMRSTVVQPGEKVMSYGNSGQRGGTEELRLREGYGSGLDMAQGWSHRPYMINPSWFGDSGSGFMDAAGGAFGVLSTLGTVPPGAAGVIDLRKALDYARVHGGLDVRLVTATDTFTGPVLGPGVVDPPEPEPVPAFDSQPAPEPAPPPAPAAAPAAAAPTSRARAPRVRIVAVRGRVIRGTARGRPSRVEVAVVRRGRPPRWRRASGTHSWRLRLSRPLRRGRHVILARAVGRDGTPGPRARRVVHVPLRS